MNFKHPIPILRIFDERKAKDFYVDYRGFSIDWEHRFEAGMPLYMQVSRKECKLFESGYQRAALSKTRNVPCGSIWKYVDHL